MDMCDICKPPIRATPKDRKEKIEQVLAKAKELDFCDAADAWERLCVELEAMTEPEARPPRFAGLLRAVWVAATNEQS